MIPFCLLCDSERPCKKDLCGCKEHPPVDDSLAESVWRFVTRGGSGTGTYSWRELRRADRERWRHAVRLIQGAE